MDFQEAFPETEPPQSGVSLWESIAVPCQQLIDARIFSQDDLSLRIGGKPLSEPLTGPIFRSRVLSFPPPTNKGRSDISHCDLRMR